MDFRCYIAVFLMLATGAPLASQTIPAEVFREKLSSENGMLIDVRTAKEYDAEHISGAINMDVLSADFRWRIRAAFDPSGTYFIYCGIGKRSATAMNIMKEEGFVEVYELEKGLQAWKAKGYETVSAAPPDPSEY